MWIGRKRFFGRSLFSGFNLTARTEVIFNIGDARAWKKSERMGKKLESRLFSPAVLSIALVSSAAKNLTGELIFSFFFLVIGFQFIESCLAAHYYIQFTFTACFRVAGS